MKPFNLNLNLNLYLYLNLYLNHNLNLYQYQYQLSHIEESARARISGVFDVRKMEISQFGGDLTLMPPKSLCLSHFNVPRCNAGGRSYLTGELCAPAERVVVGRKTRRCHGRTDKSRVLRQPEEADRDNGAFGPRLCSGPCPLGPDYC